MFYVSTRDPNTGYYGVTDTSDGVTEFFDANRLIQISKKISINGVKGNVITIVSATKNVIQNQFDSIGNTVKQYAYSLTEEQILDLAGKNGFKRKLKELYTDDIPDFVASMIYPDSIKEVVNSASAYTNAVHSINVKDKELVKNTLRNNVCLVLQLTTKGLLTAFICTGSVQIVDKIYGVGFFDTMHLTKTLYDLTTKLPKRRDTQREFTPNPDLLKVLSCSLRFKNDGKHKEKGNKVLSSTFYTVNLNNLFAMFVLNNPATLGNTILPEFKSGMSVGVYDFNLNMFNEIYTTLKSGINRYQNASEITKYITNITEPVDVTYLQERFNKEYSYVVSVRQRNYSFY